MIKIAIVTDWLAEKMGYSENLLPKALAKRNTEVHLISSTLQPAFPNYKETYEQFLGPREQPAGVWQLHGFTVHRLPAGRQKPGVYIKGLHRTLQQLQPDIVQCFTLPSYSTYQCAVSRLRLGFKLFLEEHIHMSVFSAPTRRIDIVKYKAIGILLGMLSERCYPIAPDVAEIVTEHFGYPRAKVQLCSLGVDTERFTPATTPAQREQRRRLRSQLGFAEGDLVCLYSGRFSPDKNPQCLARAIDILQSQGYPFRGLFIGNGTSEQVEEIKRWRGCVTHPFVNWLELPDYYRVADIGVWPKQESTSQLDAAASGLPLVISNRVQARERIDGNGLTYEEGQAEDLASQLAKLADDTTRLSMGEYGVQKIRQHYSWDEIARQRLEHYVAALNRTL